MDRTKLKKLLFVALLVSIGARLYINFFVPGFIITFTAIILGIALYFNEDIHPVVLGVTVAVMSPAMRLFVESFSAEDIRGLFIEVYPDVFFYITYGLVIYGMVILFDDKRAERYYIIVFLADFLSNLVELMVRTRIVHLESSMIQGILMVALGRTVLIMLSIFAVVRYTTLLVKQEHEKRYQYLMMLSARFKSEIYILHKNMNQIEELVGLSHKIKRMASEDEAMRQLTLELSKGVHEIKKDYIRAVQGLEEIYDGGINLDEVTLKDLFMILDSNTKDYLKNRAEDITCVFKCKTHVMVHEHFFLMSVLRNLINNGIEACEGAGRIHVLARDIGDEIEIIVKDDGKGIAEDDRDFVFNAGYSTKYDDATGDVYRGMGLTLVGDLVENVFKGSIRYESVIDVGTCFTILMKRAVLEKGER